MIRTYSELIQLQSFKERLDYLRLVGTVGEDTFGFDRYLNQQFYRSVEWKRVRDIVIVRDNGCDLAMPGYEIGNSIFVHHMNPIGISDICNSTGFLLNPEYLVCVSKDTHDAIHYGVDSEIFTKNKQIIERTPNDTKLW